MKRTQFFYEATDGTNINAYRWEQKKQTEVRAVIQIAHGMAEHILRYDDFCTFLIQHGFVVYGNDHRGHGNTIAAPDDKGFFATENGFEVVVNDMYTLTAIIEKEYPDIPIIMFGHSMGSFLARRFVQMYPNDVHGLILSGTAGSKGLLGKLGFQLAKWERKRKGPRTPSPLMDKLTFGNFNKKFSPTRTAFDFLSRDEVAVDEYIQDDKCGFICSTGFFIDLISGMRTIHREKEVQKTRNDLPIFLISGEMDPVGDEGEGVEKVYDQLLRAGVENVSIKLYENARHELLNELNKAEVYDDILLWLQAITKGE